MDEYDLLVVGGGINGTGIARDAAGRGLSVLLVEKDDLAGHTSSASSKLVHGGLRYLEQFQFKLVRESLAERERLLRAAPHIVRPLEIVLPLGEASRPAWMIRAGLFLYDHLAGRKLLPASRPLRLDADGRGLRPGPRKGFAYWDCRVQDSRLVVLNAMDAAERGATVLTRTELVGARREDSWWLASVRGAQGERTIRARALVNSAGPWAERLLEQVDGTQRRRRVRLVKGSHIVLPQVYAGKHAFILQNPDGRVVFAIPFETRFTLVGTTEAEWTGDPGDPAIDEAEIEYLLGTVARNFASSPSRADIVWSYSGVRTLVDDGTGDPSKVTRDYLLDLDAVGAPLLSVFGGKLTTYRSLSEKALDHLAPFFPKASPGWTRDARLPGGDMTKLEDYADGLRERWPGVPAELLSRFARTYGTRTDVLLKGVHSTDDLGDHFGGGLYAREVEYLVANEWARTAEDLLFRRTKLGLHVTANDAERLAAHMGG